MPNTAASSVRAMFRSLKYRNFRNFWIGQCISVTGTWMQRTAQVWLVYSLTKSPFLVGILGVCPVYADASVLPVCGRDRGPVP